MVAKVSKWINTGHKNFSFSLPTIRYSKSNRNMKRTCLQRHTNTDEQNTCEFHRVRKFNIEKNYNRQLISNFKILYR
jgi:hypothetical protein